jgi:hypothetical protein
MFVSVYVMMVSLFVFFIEFLFLFILGIVSLLSFLCISVLIYLICKNLYSPRTGRQELLIFPLYSVFFVLSLDREYSPIRSSIILFISTFPMLSVFLTLYDLYALFFCVRTPSYLLACIEIIYSNSYGILL